jgi:hypothetical protein
MRAYGGGEWSASLPSRFTRKERAPGTHWSGRRGEVKILDRDSRDSVVSIATGYGLDDREVGVRVPVVS